MHLRCRPPRRSVAKRFHAKKCELLRGSMRTTARDTGRLHIVKKWAQRGHPPDAASANALAIPARSGRSASRAAARCRGRADSRLFSGLLKSANTQPSNCKCTVQLGLESTGGDSPKTLLANSPLGNISRTVRGKDTRCLIRVPPATEWGALNHRLKLSRPNEGTFRHGRKGHPGSHRGCERRSRCTRLYGPGDGGTGGECHGGEMRKHHRFRLLAAEPRT